MANETTRRALLGTTIAVLAAATPAVAYNKRRGGQPCSATVASPQLIAMIAAAGDAERVCSDHHERFYKPAAALMAQAVAQAETLYPHVTVNAGPSMGGGEVIWSTAKPTSVAVARSIIEMSREGKNMAGAGLAPARTLYAAHLRRARAIERARTSYCVSAVVDDSDRLGELAADAASAVAAHPINTAPDLHAKLRFMIEREMGDGMDWLGELLADAQRIVEREG